MTKPDLDRPAWLGTLTEALSQQSRLQQVVALRPGIGARPAAVLILIGEGPAGPEIMFVERAAGLRKHAGQIAFPGGAADLDDDDLADTALREAAEETGVDRTGIEVLGVLPPAHVEVSGFDVTAVIAWWREPSPVAVMDSREAASIDIVPVAILTDPAHRALVRHPSGYVGPAFEVNGHLIWGLTAHLLDGVLDLAGWQRPWDRSREVPIPLRYLTDRRPDHGGPDAH
ncbi:MAG TPA: CoA pyrophosphatase [Propionibacteriaceae bacterium]|nr:CoA pyrophosphatase [Propionibacteriaceae bacterium]